MNDFLKKIMECKRAEVARAKEAVSETELRIASGAREDYRSFRGALKQDGVRIIAEVKRASPSKGDIQPDLDPAQMARLYEEGGAACMSVLTEPEFFKGTLDDLKAARAACSLPVLRKDFIIDPYQLYEASAAKADCVLLIARILEKEELEDLLALTHALAMDALVEIHDEEDLQKISGIGAKIVGINNRNLKTFETDLEVSLKLASQLEEDQIVVVASGIGCRDDIVQYLPDLKSFLIGESIVKAPDTVSFIRGLLG